MISWVEKYVSWGLCAIPVPYGQKEPIIQWKKYQSEKPTKDELAAWFGGDEPTNVAVVCGAVSDNFYPLDFDSEDSIRAFFDYDKLLKGTPVVRTGRGYHVWFKSKNPISLSKRAVKELNVEFLGEGHFIIAPPSRHPSGKDYEFLNPDVETIAILEDYIEAMSDRVSKLLRKPYRLDIFREISQPKVFATEAPYRGPTPICITRMYKIKKGERNEVGMRVASFFLITRKLSNAWERFTKWNKGNDPPLEDAELKAIFDSVNKEGYIYGCDDPIKHELCVHPLSCPLFKYAVPPEVEEEVNRIADSDQPLTLIKSHLDNFIAGEDYNKQLIFLLLFSGKCKDPKMKQMILLSGDSGVGKTTLMSIADLFITKTVGRFTEHGLDYSNLEGFEILRLQEIGSMDEEKQGVATVKFLSPDDKGFIVEYTVRDPETGEFGTKQKILPPITFISSTTRLEVDPQYRRRCWIISPDESAEQTLRIKALIVKEEYEENEVRLGLRKWTSHDFSKMVLREYVRGIEDKPVFIPFVNSFLDILRFDILRVRGDYKKLCNLLKLYCNLNEKALPKIPLGGNDNVLATPRAVIDLLHIAEEPLTYMTSELEKRVANTLAWLEAAHLTEAGTEIGEDEREALIRLSGKADNTIRMYLNQLQKAGFLISTEVPAERGRPKKAWRLLQSVKAIKTKMSALSFKINITDSLMAEMSKEAQNWLNSISAKMGGGRESISWPTIMERYPIPPVFAKSHLGTEKPQNPNLTDYKPQNKNLTDKLPSFSAENYLGTEKPQNPNLTNILPSFLGDITLVEKLEAYMKENRRANIYQLEYDLGLSEETIRALAASSHLLKWNLDGDLEWASTTPPEGRGLPWRI
jgi:hypothetical protein